MLGAEPLGLQALPKIQTSYASGAAVLGQRVSARARYPRYLDMGFISESTLVYEASTSTGRVFQAAFEATRAVVALTTSKCSVKNLLRAEEAELDDAATAKKQVDSNHPARGYSVVLLFRNNPRSVAPVLDAFAHLAAGGGDGKQAAGAARFSVLCGIDAEDYLCARAAALPAGRAPTAPCTGSVWLAASCAISSGKAVNLHSRCVELQCVANATPQQICESIVKTLSAFGSDPGFANPPAALLLPTQTCPRNAYLAAAERAAAQFHELLVAPDAIAFADFCDTVDYGGRLDFSEIYARLIPKVPATGAPAVDLDSPHTQFGLLCHAAGQAEEMARWIDGIKKADPARPFGLRIPEATSDEQALAVHVLYLDGTPVDVGKYLSVYGTGGVPGARLSCNGCQVYQLKPCLAPLDEALSRAFFVLPCNKDDCKVADSRASHAVFGVLGDFVKRLAPRFDRVGSKTDARTVTRKPTFSPPPTEAVDVGVGCGLDCPASRLGSVIADLQGLRGPPVEMVKTLLAASAKLGADVSVDSAWVMLRDALAEPPPPGGPSQQVPCAPPTDHRPPSRGAARKAGAAPAQSPPPAAAPPTEKLSAAGFERAMAGAGLKLGKAATVSDRGKLLTVLTKALGKRKADFEETAEAAAGAGAIKETDDSETVKVKISKVTNLLLEDSDESIYLTFMTEGNVSIVKVDADRIKPVSTTDLLNSKRPSVASYNESTRQLSYYTQETG